jgi:coiled-coil domain-containing protein 61
LMTERTKHQRTMQKKTAQNLELAAEVESLRESERSLQIRCRNLAGETALRRRASAKGLEPRRRPHSVERRSIIRSASAERRAVRGGSSGRSPAEVRRGGGGTGVSLRASAERLSRGDRPHVRLAGRAHSRSPSPGRFDPTEYVRQREEKLHAARAAREQTARRARSRSASPLSRGSSPAPRGRSREVKPVGRGGGRRRQSRSPVGSSPRAATAPNGRGRAPATPARRQQSPSLRRDGPTAAVAHSPRTDATAQPLSPPTQPAEAARVQDYFKRNAQITDIDARLEALHHFLKSAQAPS